MAALLNIHVDGPKMIHLEVKASKEVEDGFIFSPRQFKTVMETNEVWLTYLDAKGLF